MPPKGNSSLIWSDAIKGDWNDWLTYIRACGFNSVSNYINTLAWKDYQENKHLVGKSGGIRINYSRDSHELVRDKIIPMSNGEVYDQYELISGWKRFYEIEMKKRGIPL